MSSKGLKENAILIDALVRQSDIIGLVSENLQKAIALAIIFHKQSESNIAYCASQVLRATNAVVCLASDLGSINSVIQAEDSNNRISELFEGVYEQITKTANKAEIAVQLAMEASMLSSQLSLNLVQDSAQNLYEDLFNLMTNYFSQPDTLLSELSGKPFKTRKVKASGEIKSKAVKTEPGHLQAEVDFWHNELQVITEVQDHAEHKAITAVNRSVLYEQVCKDISVLQIRSVTAQSELFYLSMKINSLTRKMKAMTRELKNSADSFNGFFDRIIKMKAINPLISDDLISSCGKTHDDSSLALELCSEALKSALAARTEMLLQKSATAFGYVFYFSGNSVSNSTVTRLFGPLDIFLNKASERSKNYSRKAGKAYTLTLQKLVEAREKLALQI